LGPLLALIAYLAVVNWQYPGGWIKAAGIALFAAVASLVVLYLFQGENPAVYGGREADNSLTFHRRLQSEYPTTANLY